MKIIYLEWCDSTSDNEKWRDREEVEAWIKDEQFWIKEVGFLFEETKKHIILCSSHSPESNHYQEVFKELRKIPKTWIRRKKTLMGVK